MKKGFTLIELLAVIVILSIVGIITIPMIGNVIEDSKKKALESSARGLVEAANYFSVEKDGIYSFMFDDEHNGETSDGKKLDYKGKINGEGKLYIDNNGTVSLCINTDKYYAYKSYNSGIVVGNIVDNKGCKVEQIGIHYVAYLEGEEPSNDSCCTEELNSVKTELEALIAANDTEIERLDGYIQTINDQVTQNETDIATINDSLPFSLGIDENGNYGYIKNDTDVVIPFGDTIPILGLQAQWGINGDSKLVGKVFIDIDVHMYSKMNITVKQNIGSSSGTYFYVYDKNKNELVKNTTTTENSYEVDVSNHNQVQLALTTVSNNTNIRTFDFPNISFE